MSFALLGALAATPAAAQEASSSIIPKNTPKICHIAAQPAAAGAVQDVRAFCWGTGLVLGEAENFRSFTNPALEATLVELDWNGTKRVLLLRPDAEGRPLLEDLSGTLAAAAGRASWSGLDGLSLDYGAFAQVGTIGVAPASEGSPARAQATRSAASTETAAINIGQLIREDEARQASAR